MCEPVTGKTQTTSGRCQFRHEPIRTAVRRMPFDPCRRTVAQAHYYYYNYYYDYYYDYCYYYHYGCCHYYYIYPCVYYYSQPVLQQLHL